MLDLDYESGADPKSRRLEFDRIATAMLERIGLRVPQALHDAIRETRPFRHSQPGANITFDPGRSPFRTPTLVVRDAGIRVVAIPRSR